VDDHSNANKFTLAVPKEWVNAWVVRYGSEDDHLSNADIGDTLICFLVCYFPVIVNLALVIDCSYSDCLDRPQAPGFTLTPQQPQVLVISTCDSREEAALLKLEPSTCNHTKRWTMDWIQVGRPDSRQVMFLQSMTTSKTCVLPWHTGGLMVRQQVVLRCKDKISTLIMMA
jgi:hypothetical protein